MVSLSILVVEDNKDFRAMVREELYTCKNLDFTVLMPENIQEAQTLVSLPEEFSWAFFDFDLSEWHTSETGDVLARTYLESSHAPIEHIMDISSQLHHFDDLKLQHLGKPGLIYFIRSNFCSAPASVCTRECQEKFELNNRN